MLWHEKFQAASLDSLMLHNDTKLMGEYSPIDFLANKKHPGKGVK